MDKNYQVSKDSLATFALEVWRLSQNIENLPQQKVVALRYSLRKLKQTLEAEGCEFLDLTGKPYDAGLALEVIDIETDSEDKTDLIIKEMLAPIILFQNKLLVSGQVILAKATKLTVGEDYE
jgi:hypothetical protein